MVSPDPMRIFSQMPSPLPCRDLYSSRRPLRVHTFHRIGVSELCVVPNPLSCASRPIPMGAIMIQYRLQRLISQFVDPQRSIMTISSSAVV